MIVVKRGKEPNSLLKFRKENPDADYETDIPTEVSKDIREQMWEEQRGLCAYCMKKIKNSSVMRIEHCRARHPQDEQEHDKKDKTCDAHRGNTELTVNPFDEMSVRKIKYKADGSIYSDDAEINKDVTETLNLNCQALSLPQTRKNVLMAEKNRIMRKCKGKSQDAFMRELERTYASLTQERNLTPYCGIIISWIESKLKIS